MKVRTRALAGAGIAGLGLIMSAPAALAAPGVDPASVTVALTPGVPLQLDKTVTTVAEAPKLDLYFLADTTGSMFGPITNVQANAADILASVASQVADVQFGAGDYKDFPNDPYAFNNAAPLGSAGAAQAAIDAWTADGGFDGAEGQLFALQQLAGDAGWRAGAAHVLVWFGDAPGHDPICSAISGLASEITEATATDALVAQRIRVIAVSTNTGFADGLDDDPTIDSFDYFEACGGDIDGTAGQGTRITDATLGEYFTGVSSDGVTDAILAGLTDLQVLVTPVITCDPGLSVELDAPNKATTPGGSVDFTEQITLANPPPPGQVTCTVTMLQDGVPVEGFTQTIQTQAVCPGPVATSFPPPPLQALPPVRAIPTAFAGAPFPSGEFVTEAPQPTGCPPVLPVTGPSAPTTWIALAGVLLFAGGVALVGLSVWRGVRERRQS